jgi:acid stress chaperone HdeB
VKIISAVCFAIVIAAANPAFAQKVDLSTIKCKDFVESPTERISLILMWLTGYYADEDDPPVIDFDEMKEKAQKLGEYCGKNPDIGLMTAAEETFSN